MANQQLIAKQLDRDGYQFDDAPAQAESIDEWEGELRDTEREFKKRATKNTARRQA